jgi:hypothetical protein
MSESENLTVQLMNEIYNHKHIDINDVKDTVYIADTEFNTNLLIVATKQEIIQNIINLKFNTNNNDKDKEEKFIGLKTNINETIKNLGIEKIFDLYDTNKEHYLTINNDIVDFYCQRYAIFNINIPIVQI